MMNNSGLIQTPAYDSGAASAAAMTRAIMAPNYITNAPYTGVSTTSMVAHQHQQHNPFSGSQYGGPGSNSVVPHFANYIQRRPQYQNDPQPTDGLPRPMPYSRNVQQAFVEEHHSPTIKPEPNAISGNGASWNVNTGMTAYPTAPPTVVGNGDVNFGTDVDTLMKAIQAKATQPPGQPQENSPPAKSRSVVGSSASSPVSSYHHEHAPAFTVHPDEEKQRLTGQDTQDSKAQKKRYECTIVGCDKSFYQKTHLEIHVRAHTGAKPYSCKHAGCYQRFSQLGNLKTHERRHTGERPYACETCGKRFAQRGNVRAHRIVHDQAKPFVCKLEDCGKTFTQLGNLKSHQNKFHAHAIRVLTSKFASIQDGDTVTSADKELWEYFANLYKNSNKGIKGRGKDRKVGSALHSSGSGMGLLVSRTGMLSSNMGHQGGQSMAMHDGHPHGRYEMYDVSECGSASGSGGQGGGSSGSSMYSVDAPSETYEADGRDLAFGDRIY